MSTEAVVEEKIEEKVIDNPIDFNPFDDVNRLDKPPVFEEKKSEPIVEEKKPEPIIEENKPEPIVEKKPEPVIEEKKPEPVKIEVDFEKVYDIMHQKKVLDKAIKADATNAKDAETILKISLRNKYSELDDAEIQDAFEEQYGITKKPVQYADELGEEYEVRVKEWETSVEKVQKKMIRDAKMAKPELVELQNKLVLPEINTPVPEAKAPSQEELAENARLRNEYLQQLESGIRDFNGFSTVVKDKDVETNVVYTITDQEKAALKTRFSDFDMVDYFDKRWVPENGKFDTKLMNEDVYLIENKQKIFDKIATDAYNKALETFIKTEKNINVNTQPTQNGGGVDYASEEAKMIEKFYSN